MKNMYKMSLALLLVVVMSASVATPVIAARVVELMPNTAKIVKDRINFNRLRHGGTSREDGDGQETCSSQLLVFPAVVVDVQEKVAANPTHTISERDLLAWEEKHGKIPRGSIVLLRTGWNEEWERQELKAEGEFRFPTCNGTVTPFLLYKRKAAGIGIDRVHTFTEEDADPAEVILNRLGRASEGVVLENLENLDQLPTTGVNLQIGVLYRADIREKSTVSVKAFLPKE